MCGCGCGCCGWCCGCGCGCCCGCGCGCIECILSFYVDDKCYLGGRIMCLLKVNFRGASGATNIVYFYPLVKLEAQ